MTGVGVLYATTEAKVVRNFLLACAIADVGHLYVTYAVMYAMLNVIPRIGRTNFDIQSRGYTDFTDVQAWNPTAWGNIGVTLGLFLVRLLYLMGFLGQDKVVNSTKKA